MDAAPSMPVLVVGDESLVLDYVEDVLEGTRFEVVGVATSAAEALELAGRLRPRLAIVDVTLQAKRDGLETARLMRERFGNAVVLVTGSPGWDLGAVSARLLRKPFLARQLLTVLDAAVSDVRG